MMGVSIWMPSESLPAPGPDEFYLNDILGFAVVGPEGAFGTVVAVHATGPVEVLELSSGDYVPCTHEHIAAIDEPTRTVHLQEGGCSSMS